jgi:hypothetical protein
LSIDRWGPRACLSLSMAGVIGGVFMLSLASPVRDTYFSGVLLFGMVCLV